VNLLPPTVGPAHHSFARDFDRGRETFRLDFEESIAASISGSIDPRLW
jgi:hypothetical protein